MACICLWRVGTFGPPLCTTCGCYCKLDVQSVFISSGINRHGSTLTIMHISTEERNRIYHIEDHGHVHYLHAACATASPQHLQLTATCRAQPSLLLVSRPVKQQTLPDTLESPNRRKNVRC